MLNESPESYPDPGLLPYKNSFNWTITYRFDSDVPAPGGKFTPRNKDTPFIFNPKVFGRKKLAAAMISNCDNSSIFH